MKWVSSMVDVEDAERATSPDSAKVQHRVRTDMEWSSESDSKSSTTTSLPTGRLR